MSSLVAVQCTTLIGLLEGAMPQSEADETMCHTLNNAAASGSVNLIVKREDLERLEEIQRDKKAVEVSIVVNDRNLDEVPDVPKRTLIESIRALDPKNDAHWTKGGKPDIKAVQKLFGKECNREAIDNAAPDFDREAAAAAGQGDQDESEDDDEDSSNNQSPNNQ